MNLTPFEWQQQEFVLTPQRLLYWPAQQALVLSDLHLGKTGHFRKEGIAVPQQAYQHDLHVLFSAIQWFRPRTVMVVGDLVHSRGNKELDLFARWRQDLTDVDFLLIRGNHDVLSDSWYTGQGITVVPEHRIGHMVMVHDLPGRERMAAEPDTAFICGHVHPAVRVSGISRQTLRLPCFYFGQRLAILPAFGKFTGTYVVKPSRKDCVFAIADQHLVAL